MEGRAPVVQSEKLKIARGCDQVVNIYSVYHQCTNYHYLNYRTHTIITRGWYIYYSIFEDNSVLMYGQYSREIYIQERVMMACVHHIFFKIQYAESYRPVHCAVNVTSPEVSRSYSEKVHKLDSSEIFLLFSSFFLLFCHAKFQMLFKVIHPKYYEHLKEAAQNRHLGR